jgi:hypothetical protein
MWLKLWTANVTNILNFRELLNNQLYQLWLCELHKLKLWVGFVALSIVITNLKNVGFFDKIFVLSHINQAITFVSSPRTPENLLVFIVAWWHHIGIDKYIRIRSNNKLKEFYLKDIVYHGVFYFVWCVVGKDTTIWFHDGKLSRNCICETSWKNLAPLNYKLWWAHCFFSHIYTKIN